MPAPNEETISAMLHLITRFKGGRVPLFKLCADLEAGLRGLLVVAPDWVEAFRREWRVLEEANALALDESEFVVPQKMTGAVSDALDELELLLRKELRREEKPSKDDRA